MYRIICKIMVAVAIIFIFPFTAQAAKLKKQECRVLQAKKAALVKAGASKNMGRGIKWVKKNLKEPALKDLKTYIELSEKLLFQCGHRTMKHVKLRSRPPAAKTKPKTKKKPLKSADNSATSQEALQAIGSGTKPQTNKPGRMAAASNDQASEQSNNNDEHMINPISTAF